MATPVTTPDGKKVAVDLLAAALPGVHVAGKTPPEPEFTKLLPGGIVRVLRVGGVRSVRTWGGRSAVDNPRLSIDCYAQTDGEASRLAQRVLDEWELLPDQSTPDGYVTGVSIETGPQDRPEEPNTGVARIGTIVGMSVRPPRTAS